MRAAPVALAVAGMLMAVAALAPSASACTLLPSPLRCVTDLYEKETKFVSLKLQGLQSWGAVVPGYLVACPAQGPGAGPAQPVLLLAEAYKGQMGAHLAAFQAGSTGPQGNPFAAAAELLGDGWFDTVGFALAVDEHGNTVVVGLMQDLAGALPDPAPFAGSLSQGALASGGQARDFGVSTGGCAAASPLPPL